MLEETFKRSDGKSAFPLIMGIKVADPKARLREGAEDLKDRVGEMFEDAVADAKRMAKKGRYAAEDLIDDTEYKIKKAPFRSVWMTFAAGMGIGLVAGVFVSRLTGTGSNEIRH
jgi:ElaB/YqjD/DUF883 family membrane-anchored ribosome-binding protein